MILVTGATGFIGSRLVLDLREENLDVRAAGQSRNDVETGTGRALQEAGAELVIGSITEADEARQLVDGVDCVVHLAAAQHEANVPDQHFHDVNVTGTRNMLEASVASGVKRFVHGSTIGVYGWTEGRDVDEDSPLVPDNIYGVTKLEGETVAREYMDRLPIAIARIAEVYGPGDRRLLKLFKGVKKGLFLRIGSGKNTHHLVYIDDLIRGLRLAASHEAAVGACFVLAGPAPVASSDMIRSAAAAIGCRPPPWVLPMGPMMAAAWLTESILRPLGVQPPLHRRRLDFFRKSFSFRGDQALELLGFEPRVRLQEGMDATARWYEREGLLL
ncbi:MAG: NAD(P)-dependent oxidoreductase [bacterium]|nr:NAD(P)-dependent oxidoreductase [bacterium]